MRHKQRTLLPVITFVCIISLLLMTACGVGKTGSDAGTDINSQTSSALANETASQTDSDSASGTASQTDSDSASGTASQIDSDSAKEIAAQPGSGSDTSRRITILATSDMHANVMSFSYEDNAETEKDGMPACTHTLSSSGRRIPTSSW